jgi:hypothetical protein
MVVGQNKNNVGALPYGDFFFTFSGNDSLSGHYQTYQRN